MNNNIILNILTSVVLIVVIVVMGWLTYDTYTYATNLSQSNIELENHNKEISESIEVLSGEYEELNALSETLSADKENLQSINEELIIQVATLSTEVNDAKEYIPMLLNELEYSQDNSQPLTEEIKAMLDEIEGLSYAESTPDRQARLFLYAFYYAIPQEVRNEFFEDGYTIKLAENPTRNCKGYIQLNYGYGIVIFQTDLSYSYVLCHEMGHYVDVKTRSLDGEFSDPCSLNTASMQGEFTNIYNEELYSPFEEYVSISYHNQRKEFFANSYAMYALYYDEYKDTHPHTFAFIDERLEAFK